MDEQIETPREPTDALQQEPREQKESSPPPAGVDPDEWANDADFTPKQQSRFNRIYKQMKEGQRVNEQLATDNVALLDKLDRLDAKIDGQVERQTEDRLAGLDREIEEAVKDDDVARVKLLTNEIADTRMKTSQSIEPDPEPAAEPTSELQLSQADAEKIQEWAFERDDRGDYSRPWSHPGHPRHDEFLALANEIAPTAQTVEQGLAEVERRMTPKRAAAVLPSDANYRPPGRPSELTEPERSTALRMMGPGTRMNLSAADAVKRYRESKTKHGIGR